MWRAQKPSEVSHLGNEKLVEKTEDIIANVPQLVLNLLPVFFGKLLFLLRALSLLLYGGDNSPGTSPKNRIIIKTNLRAAAAQRRKDKIMIHE